MLDQGWKPIHTTILLRFMIPDQILEEVVQPHLWMKGNIHDD